MSFRTACLCAFPMLLAGTAAGQALPTRQPTLIDITREFEKPGHSAAHEATEAKWAHLNRTAGYPVPYIALVAASGGAEVWWISALESFDALGKSYSFGDDQPPYRAGIAKVAMEDSDHINNVVRMQARAVPEASHGEFPEIGKARVYSVMTVRTRPGHEQAFTEMAKHYVAIAAGSKDIVGWRAYQVIAGAPAGTYLVMSTFPSWAAVDANEAAWGKAMMGAGAHMQAAAKLAGETMMNSDVRYFTVNPKMSLVSKELAASDPFWAPKPATARGTP